MVIIPKVIRMTYEIVSKMVVSDEIYENKEELEKKLEILRKMISKRIVNTNNDDLKDLPIEVNSFF